MIFILLSQLQLEVLKFHSAFDQVFVVLEVELPHALKNLDGLFVSPGEFLKFSAADLDFFEWIS